MKDNKPIINAAVLAGGKSSRMGRDKRFLLFRGESLVIRATKLAAQITREYGGKVILCGDVPGFLSLPDTGLSLGPLGGILTAVQSIHAAPSQSSWLLIIPVDMPLLSPPLLQKMLVRVLEADSKNFDVICFDGFELPLFLKTSQYAEQQLIDICLQKSSSGRSVGRFLSRLRQQRLTLEPDCHEQMVNTNSPADWLAAQAREYL